MIELTPYTYGIHDPGGAELLTADGMTGWIVITEGIGHDPNDLSGKDYRYLSDRGITVIVRLNNGYSGAGTIPNEAYYADFAKRCANFVKASRGCCFFVIANEPNHMMEWPDGVPIEAKQYVLCFEGCYAAIKAVRPEVDVLTAAIAPWNVDTGMHWMAYAKVLYDEIESYDGIAIHTYSRDSSDPASILAETFMGAPYEVYHNGFQTYKDWLLLVPPRTDIYLTETNQNIPWDHGDITIDWVDTLYAEVDRHNLEDPEKQIRAVILYCWNERADGHGFRQISSVKRGLRSAMMYGYTWSEYNQPPPPLLDVKSRLGELNKEIRLLTQEGDRLLGLL